MGSGMRRTFRPLLLLGGAASLIYAAYRVLLTDQARADLADCVHDVQASWERLTDAVGLAPDNSEAEQYAAQCAAREQWKRIGY